jgi:hypothetical protein
LDLLSGRLIRVGNWICSNKIFLLFHPTRCSPAWRAVLPCPVQLLVRSS